MKDSSKLVGQGGSITLGTGQSYAGEFYLISVREDTVIGTLTRTKRDGNTVDALAATENNITARTLILGDLITPVNTLYTAITVTSGSVTIYRG